MTSGNPDFGHPPDPEATDAALAHLEQATFAGEVVLKPTDFDLARQSAEDFMRELHGNDRYTGHNERILGYYDRYSGGELGITTDPNTVATDRTTIVLHDLVEHAILNPRKMAARLEHDPTQVDRRADEIRSSAISMFDGLLEAVEDRDGLLKAYLFAIDASKWEAAARIWRPGATSRVNDLVAQGRIDSRTGEIVISAVNKTPALDEVDKAELERVLKMKETRLVDLKLGAISDGTINHNIRGLFFKSLETLDLIEHPPAGNPASTWRDCTEAINFFVPALAVLGYKRLAADLRGAVLKVQVDDPEGHAKQQYDKALEHYDDIDALVSGLREVELGGIDVHTESRIKTEGSTREKLESPKYRETDVVPDGVGFAFIIPDHIGVNDMERLSRDFMEKLVASSEGTVESKHTLDGEQSFDLERKLDSGYEAVHMTFYYYPPDNPSDYVPFEIQVMTSKQHMLKLYGRSSDLFYKDGNSYHPEQQPHLDRLRKRARAEREIAPGSTIQSIAEMVAVSPEIPSVFNSLFRAIDIPGRDTRVLVPIELEETAREVFAVQADETREYHEYDNLIILPATKVSKAQFLEALEMLERGLATDKHILQAIELVSSSGASELREDGLTTVLEGHLLPTALAAAMMAIQSGAIWEDRGEELGPTEQISDIVTIALLHDFVEASLDSYKGKPENVIGEKRHDELFNIEKVFGSDIMDGVDAMTLPIQEPDRETRRAMYTEQIQGNDYARLVKPADRLQNHLTDVVRLATSQGSLSSDGRQAIMDYFAKTDSHLIDVFTSAGSPLYSKTQQTVWEFARHFGYIADNEAA